MDSVLGTVEATPINTPQPGVQQNAVTSDSTRVLERLVRKVESWDSRTPGTASSQSNETAPKGQKYDDYDRAAIKGFAGIINDREIPRFYSLAQTTTNVNHHRINLDKGMRLWSEHMRIEIDEGVFFLKDNIESFVKVEPNPGECIANYNTAEKGVTPLSCKPRSAMDIEKERVAEQAEYLSRVNRTMAEAIKLSKTETRRPPQNYHELKLNVDVATYAALLWVLYGEQCDLYKKVLAIWECLDSKWVKASKEAYTSDVCASVIWAIIEDSRNFFSVRLHPDDFAGGTAPTFPTSGLLLLLPQIRHADIIKRNTFPMAWAEHTHAQRTNFPWQSGFINPPPAGPAPPVTSFLPPNANANSSPANKGGNKSSGNTDPLGHLHPIIKNGMATYHTIFFGQVRLAKIMELGNLEWKDIPIFPGLQRKRRNNLCLANTLGVCNRGAGCPFAKVGGHKTKEEIPDEFATSLIKKLEPGVKAICSQETERVQREGNPIKRPSGF